MPAATPKKFPLARACLLALPVVLGAAYLWILMAAKLEWGGSKPNEKVLGTADSVYQRSMDQYCTGVVITPKSTWLVGKQEGVAPDEIQKLNAAPLDALLQGDAKDGGKKDGSEADSTGWLPAYGSGDRPKQSYISRLDDTGHFTLVATVGDDACLVASNDGEHVFLLTGLDTPHDGADIKQSAIFRTDDQGKSWQWMKDGFFPQANTLAWSLQPQFFKGGEVWVWDEPHGDDQDTGLFYSPDLGKTVVPVQAKSPVGISEDEAQKHLSTDSKMIDGDIKRYIQQTDDGHAVGWWSQDFYSSGPDDGDRSHYSVTLRLQLTKVDGTWEITGSTRDDGLYLDKVTQSPQGDFYAVTSRDQRPGQAIERFNAGTGKWEEQGKIPSPFAPLSSNSTLRSNSTYTFSVGPRSMVVTTDSVYAAPRLFNLFSEGTAHISADANYYSTNGGKSWKKLGLVGYLGILGFDPSHDRVIGADGNWYDSRDPRVYAYDLAP